MTRYTQWVNEPQRRLQDSLVYNDFSPAVHGRPDRDAVHLTHCGYGVAGLEPVTLVPPNHHTVSHTEPELIFV